MLGSWENKFTLTVIAIHMLHLPDGRILFWVMATDQYDPRMYHSVARFVKICPLGTI